MVTTGYLEHDAEVRGMRLHYQEWGNPASPTIIMLHGFGVSGHMFDEFAERMQDDYHLIALDQRGHGDSDWAQDGDYSRDSFVADLEGFRQSLGIERFILVGHSMGGLNSVAYTVAHPQSVRALVLVDVGPESAKEGVDNIVRFTRGPDELEFEEFVEMAHRFNPRRSIENIRERMRHRLKPSGTGKYTWKFDRRFREQDNGLRIGSALTNDESWQMFRQVTAPTLLVRGAESDVLSQAVAERATREMPRTRLTVVASAGHSVPGDNPDDFTAAVREFLADVQHGHFEPLAATEPPPLQQLLEEHEAARRRGASLGALIVGGAAAALALAGVSYMWRRRAQASKKGKEQQRAQSRRQAALQRIPTTQLPSIDVDAARARATNLLADLSVVGRSGVSRAASTARDIDLERARHAAADLVQALGEGSRTAPAAVRTAVAKADRRKQGQGKGRSPSTGRRVAKAVVVGAVTTGLARRRAKPEARRGFFPWQR